MDLDGMADMQQKHWAIVALALTALLVWGCGDEASNGSNKLTDLGTTADSTSEDGTTSTDDDATTTTSDDATTSTNNDATQDDTSITPDATPTGCVTDCDCPQGEACLADGNCLAVAEPRYCCDNAGCPQGAACKDGAGTSSVCAGCQSNCECPQGEVCGVDGSCFASATPSYCCDNAGCPSGEACTDAAGVDGSCPACASHCDCPQGEICTATGECIAAAQPVYCCANEGCPAGEACSDAGGQADVCPGDPDPTTCTNHCDCAQGKDCVNGACVDGTLPKYCCSNPGCPTSTPCQDEQGGFGLCPAAGCTQSCDCEQGQTCNNGECRRSFNQTYCCDKPGCPGGESCVDTQSQVGTCPVVATSCNSTADCAPRGADWLCDTADGHCYKPGSCDGNDATIAPCASGTCNFLGVCECDDADPNSCRAGETCNRFAPQIPGACLAN